MQHLNWFFCKENGCNIHTVTHTQRAHSITNRNRKYGPAHRKSKASRRWSSYRTAAPGGSAGPYRPYWWGEQVDISIFCLEDFHPHSNKTKVPQASPGH